MCCPPLLQVEYRDSDTRRLLHNELGTYFTEKIVAEVKSAEKRAAEPEKHEFSPPTKLHHLASVGLSQMPSNQLFAIQLGLYTAELGVHPRH